MSEIIRQLICLDPTDFMISRKCPASLNPARHRRAARLMGEGNSEETPKGYVYSNGCEVEKLKAVATTTELARPTSFEEPQDSAYATFPPGAQCVKLAGKEPCFESSDKLVVPWFALYRLANDVHVHKRKFNSYPCPRTTQ